MKLVGGEYPVTEMVLTKRDRVRPGMILHGALCAGSVGGGRPASAAAVGASPSEIGARLYSIRERLLTLAPRCVR